jgi:predicted ATPase/GAF domain-containing protein/tRNA A-37 threonylcarbamoyl transferase component Bud32
MNAIANYKILSKIYESSNSLIYRATDVSDQQAVILKVLKKDYPIPAELIRYKQEYEITRSLKVAGAIEAYDLLPYGNTLAIVLEDFGGASLEILMELKKINLSKFLQIAIQITEALEGIHAANIIHKDINPANIVCNDTTGRLRIIDFGISTAFTRENPTLKCPTVMEGTLAYMSPEQTGRMNRILDYRTDFYSLGVTFYKLLTQRLPFAASDALELVHCHLAKQPIPPCEVDRMIPSMVSDIVMKLLAKMAEDRYQSAGKIKTDLEECLTQLQQTGRILAFPLAHHDISDQLKISQKLYGRESELKFLLSTFERVAECDPCRAQARMLLISGYAGIGKSVLIQELCKPITQKYGYFIHGKFDQFQRSIPYSAVVAAFQCLVRQLLTERELQLLRWRENLLAALGDNGQVAIDLIPEIEQIIGCQPPVRTLEATETQNRFNTVFQNLLEVFCQQSHPLVLFLDDLQWADSASLKLIQLMLTNSKAGYLLLLGAYRDNEVNPSHLTMLTIDQLEEQGVEISSIILNALKIDEVTEMLADTLYSDRESVTSLAELVFAKTLGNPFFINEFLKTIHQENLLTFDRDQKCWQWNIAQIEELSITANVVDLMVGRLKKLSETTRKALSLAACIGNSFDINTLSIIYGKSVSETFEDLFPAVQAELIRSCSGLELTLEEPIESSLFIRDYQFRHDRVQQAASMLIDDEEKKIIHYRIGKLLLANLKRKDHGEKIFTLVDHLNRGQSLIELDAEKIMLAELNLKAGKKAKEAIAYSASRNYLLLSASGFPGDIWTLQYSMARDLYKELIEIEYLNENSQQSQFLIELALQQARTSLDRADFYYLQITHFTLLGKISEAFESGRNGLRSLGIDLPMDNLTAAFHDELTAYRENLGNREVSSLYEQPEMILPEKRAALKTLIRILPAAWVLNPLLMCIVGAKMVNLNIEYGHMEKSPTGYACFGVINAYMLRNYHLAYEYGCLSVRLSDKYKTLSSNVGARQFHASMIMPWLKHIKLSEQVNLDSVNAGLQVGDLQPVAYSLTYNIYNLIYQGKGLNLLLKEIDRSLAFSQESKNQWSIDCILAAKILVRNLLGLTQDKCCFDIEETSETHFLETCQRNNILAAICLYYIFKAEILCLYDQPIELRLLQQSVEWFDYIPGTISIAKHNFYYSLTLISLCSQASTEDRDLYWQQLQANQLCMKEWADNCPENFLHKYLLVAAEMSRISGMWQQAINLYDRAIDAAKEHEFVHNEALANELAAKFWLGRNKEDFAQFYMRKAHQGYQIWGARRKVELLEEIYPQWFSSGRNLPAGNAIFSTTSQRSIETLDLTTVLKATQAISSEIVLENLIEKLIQIAIENAGAQKGCLILKHEGDWVLEAQGDVGGDRVTILQSIPIDSIDPHSSISILPTTIVNYVVRTQENVVLNDASNEGQFVNDPYIVAANSKSILCTPLLNQGQLKGVVYLENNLTTGAFTSDRVDLLNILSAQAAISIDNSRLYQSLEQIVSERTQELSQTLEVLKATQAELLFENELLKSPGQPSSFKYQVGGSLRMDAATYVVRAADRYFYKSLKSGEFCYILNPRQMGKSSLMVRMIKYLQQEGAICASIDMTLLGSEVTTPEQWYKGLAFELVRRFSLQGQFNLKPWWQERDDISPVQRLSEFIESVLLENVGKEAGTEPKQLFIFIDEIDSILGLNFPVNDFFALIRSCYNQRSLNPAYQRLTFVLIGVATPSDLITNVETTPFNIGQTIQLEGFKEHEAQPLLQGFADKSNNPQTLLKEVFAWTSGQPFLTQKLCSIICQASSPIPTGGEAAWIEQLVRMNVIENWETQDEPEHLKTIRDRLLRSKKSVQLLELYQQVLNCSAVVTTNSSVVKELLLSGIVVDRQGALRVNNRIYETIFDLPWVERHV